MHGMYRACVVRCAVCAVVCGSRTLPGMLVGLLKIRILLLGVILLSNSSKSNFQSLAVHAPQLSTNAAQHDTRRTRTRTTAHARPHTHTTNDTRTGGDGALGDL